MEPPLASIVIVCFGKRELTERCLLSLDRALGDRLGAAFELVLVDNASPDATLELLDAWRDRATVVALPQNRDFAGGCNAGAAAARGEVLIFLNNDTVVEPDTLGPLAETAREPGVGAAGLRLLYADGTIQHAGVVMAANPNLGGTATAYHAFLVEDGATPAARGTYELDCVTGACLAIRRAVFAELNGFDAGYRNGYEDVDLCLRIRMSGRTVVYRGDLAFLHDEGGTRAGIDDWPNVQRLLGTWQHLLEPDHALAATAWDADVLAEPDGRSEPATPIVVAGQPSGVGPLADEARALLLALERAGAPAVAVDYGQRLVRARVGGATGGALARANARALPGQALMIAVPPGPAIAAKLPEGAWVRVVAAPSAPAALATVAAPSAAPGDPSPSSLPGARGTVEPPSPLTLPATGDAAEATPSAIDAPPAPGPGGGGVLVSLPAHDLPRTRALLVALAASDCPTVTLVPTVVPRGLASLVAELLPHAVLCGPLSDEQRWIELAAAADVAVCLDPDDRFERRALCAAAAGALPLVASSDGPAATVLGDLAHVLASRIESPALPATLSAARARAAQSPAARERRAAIVRATCDPQAVGLALLRRLAGGGAAVAA